MDFAKHLLFKFNTLESGKKIAYFNFKGDWIL
jgi:hypothetical protein